MDSGKQIPSFPLSVIFLHNLFSLLTGKNEFCSLILSFFLVDDMLLTMIWFPCMFGL